MEDATPALTCCITRKPKVLAAEYTEHHDLEMILNDQKEKPCNLPLRYLQDITDNFSEKQELGRGAFGVVYKGVLHNGQVVAVKKLRASPEMDYKHFENEVYHLTRLKHENIVRIVGYCYEIQHILIEHNGKYCFAEMPQRLLCLEFLSKGSLEKHISDESHGLDWHNRYKIIMGICRGLYHLHEEWQTGTPIIHLDLKPDNIFLNDNMVPKIADFGLSRLFELEQTREYTRNLVGSLGYMAPEYLNKGIISIKTDIFSLGVIIIQIIVGHKNYPDSTGTCTQDFVDCVVRSWRNRFKELKDTSAEKNCEQIKRCIEIGLHCVQNDAAKRPKAREIIESLDRLDSRILHVRNKSPVDKVDDHFRKKSDMLFEHGKEKHIPKKLKIHSDYCEPEEGKSPPKDGSCIEILEQAERRDLQLGEASISLPVSETSLRGRLLYLENRVALTRILFPVEAKVAMDIAKVDTLEFTIGSDTNPNSKMPGTFDLNCTVEMKEKYLARIRALSRSVELGRRYFPSCSKVLDRIMDDEHKLGGTSRKRYHELQDVLQKAFREDKESSMIGWSVGERPPPRYYNKRAQPEPDREKSRKLAPSYMGMPPPMVRALTRALRFNPRPAPYTRACLP